MAEVDSDGKIDIIRSKIHAIRGHRVILDYDLANLYDVETKVLNQSVKRNLDRFPSDFMFRLTELEWFSLRSQFVTLENGRGKYPKFLPYAFTEHGVAMLSSVLRNAKAVKMNIAIVRAFIAIRQISSQQWEILNQLTELRNRIGEHDNQIASIYDAIENLLDEKAEMKNWANRARIGFKE